jgi:glycosyltransferase involved in cell wall biosynthesis
MEKKKWTIIVRTQGKNNDLELKNALNSLIAQTYENISIIITIHNDNEKVIKETLSFLVPFQKMIEIKPIVVRKKQGNRSYPLNVALRYVDSEYLSFLDNDDIYYPNMGKGLINIIEKNKASFAYGRSIKAIEKKEEDNLGNTYLYLQKKFVFETKDFNKISFLMDNYIPFNSFIVKTSLIGNTRFDEKLYYLEDWDFLRHLVLKKDFSIAQLHKPVSEYRLRNDDTDTFNEKNSSKWEESRLITDKNIENKKLEIDFKDINDLFKQQNNERNQLRGEIARISSNPAYKLWVKVRDNKIVKKTIGRVLNIIRKNK